MNQGDNNSGAVAGSFNFAAQLPNGKSLTFSGYILQGEGEDTLNQKLDMAAKVIERQRLIAEIPELEKKMEQTETAKSQVETIIEDLSGKDKLSSQERQTLNTMRVNLKKIDEDIRRGEIAIADAKRQAATFV